jgi:hypothetical protein
MGNIGRAMEKAVNTVSTVRLDHTAFLRLGVLFYHVAVVSEQRSGFDEFDGLV